MVDLADNPSHLILTINGGSSSIKFAIFQESENSRLLMHGQIDRVGRPNARLTLINADGKEESIDRLEAGNVGEAGVFLAGVLKPKLGKQPLTAIGHRVVHGGPHLLEHQRITAELLTELKRTVPMDAAHLPAEIALIEVFANQFPNVPQVACFDTAFARDLPRVAKLLPIPRRYEAMGIHRFGFHGLSYAYLMQELKQVAGEKAANGKVILAHLGNGSSMTAIKDGKPIDTSMSFTPTAGIMMGNRPGDFDPGLLTYLMRSETLSIDQMDEFLNKHCGLMGISETSADMRDLIAKRTTDIRAAEAIDVFCYYAKKQIGAYAAAMNGLDTIVFAGGIGENAPEVRAQICEGLEFFNVNLDNESNEAARPIISNSNSRVVVRVIKTNEEVMIATETRQIICQ